jgi:hypothetical protein
MNENDLQLLLDERAIISRINLYCTAIDTGAFERLREVYLPDATARLGATEFGTLEAIIDKCVVSVGRLDGAHHMVTNHVIDVTGDTATSRCYLQAQHINNRVDGEKIYTMAGFYDDTWERSPVGWRIRRRVLTITWTAGNPAVTAR